MKYLKIPIGLCVFCLKNKLSKPFSLYLLLKMRCSSIIKIGMPVARDFAEELGYKSVKSIYYNLKILQDYNFVGLNPRNDIYVIRGFDKLRSMYKLPSTIAVLFYPSDLRKIKGFLIGSLITSLIYKEERRIKAVEFIEGRSNHAASSFLFPASNLILSKLLNISISTASEYKKCAVKHGYITITPNLKYLPIHYRSVQFYRKSNPEDGDKLVIRNKKVYLQQPDLVCSRIEYKYRKKIES
jgi:hypothetical protein